MRGGWLPTTVRVVGGMDQSTQSKVPGKGVASDEEAEQEKKRVRVARIVPNLLTPRHTVHPRKPPDAFSATRATHVSAQLGMSCQANPESQSLTVTPSSFIPPFIHTLPFQSTDNACSLIPRIYIQEHPSPA